MERNYKIYGTFQSSEDLKTKILETFKEAVDIYRSDISNINIENIVIWFRQNKVIEITLIPKGIADETVSIMVTEGFDITLKEIEKLWQK